MAVKLETVGLKDFVSSEELQNMKPLARVAQDLLHTGEGAGNDYLGWVDWPMRYDTEEFARIKNAAKHMQEICDVFLVIGIGGSYLGARAGIEFVRGPMYNSIREEGIPEVYFVGQNISSSYLSDIMQIIGERDFGVNIISKSGTTTEPAIAFRIFKDMLEKKYGKEGAKSRIIATTDASKGALHSIATEEGYETFCIPDDVGGRFSVLTPVGLLPLAVAGVDIDDIMQGALSSMMIAEGDDFDDAARYAAYRSILYHKGKSIEILANYEPSFTMFGEWFKQLFAESEGKDQKGIFPTAANFSTDLHSIGQFIQDGTRNLFETVLWVKKPREDLSIPGMENDLDGLNYLAGSSLQHVNAQAYSGTLIAHIDGGAPNIVINVDDSDAWHFGYLVYFFERACGISGYMLGVNPFNQPGVEDYKRNMFALLGKPGYEEQKKILEARMK